MKIDFQDPAILIPIGVILVCFFALIWAIGQLFKKTPVNDPLLDLTGLPSNDEFSLPAQVSPASVPEFALPSTPPPLQPSVIAKPMMPAAGPAPAQGREMVERLDMMSQRLNDMQVVLQRQANTAPAGTPLSPETIDKLLKIVGSVTQQVDLLQKSLGGLPAGGVSASIPSPASSPLGSLSAVKPVAASAPMPVAPVIPPPVAAKPVTPPLTVNPITPLSAGASMAAGMNAASAPAKPPTASTPPLSNIPPKPAVASTGSATPTPAASPSGAQPKGITAEPSNKGLGLMGGALSKFGKPTPGKTPPAGNPPTEPPTTPPGK